jgi:translation initiation factor IF-3
VTVMFRGREITHPEIAQRLLKSMAEELAECAVVERAPKLEGRNLIMILSPKS